VSDAFVSAARESDAAGATNAGAYQTRWSWNERPVVTAIDGAFTLTKLVPGNYTIRAYRRGGGEAIAEHVAVGGTAKLTIKSTGSIAGRVLGAPDEFAITVRELATGFRRREELFHTGGVYALADLPRGKYIVIAEARTGIAQVELELRDGEARSGVDFTLDAYVTATGRVVELGTGKPIAGVTMSIRRVRGGGVVAASEDHDHVSDAAGRFTVRSAPQGQVVVTGWGDAKVPYEVQAFRQLRGSGTVELGDVEAVKRRLRDDEIAGDLGLKFAEQAFDTPPDKRERKVSYIDPKGPAARTGIVVGDVVVAIDGIDVTNEHAGRAAQLLAAPPGTKVALTLARGPTVAIVLGNP
jgi:membrane-associated protease RseP (regulator of RpoE activity)